MRTGRVRWKKEAALTTVGFLLIAASALGVEIGGPEMIDTESRPEPPKEKPVEKPVVKPPSELERPVEEPPKPEPPEPPEPRERRPRRPLGITLRASYLLPSSADGTYAGALAFGASYTLAPEESPVSLELGLDAAWSAGEGGEYSSTLTFLRAAARYRLLPSVGQLYVLGGASIGFESVEGLGSSPNSAGTIDLGVGGEFGPVDSRLAYSFYLGSENAGGALALSVGYAF